MKNKKWGKWIIKRDDKHSEPEDVGELVYRIISAFIVRRLVNTRITPNQITALGGVIMAFGLYQFILGRYLNLLIGLLCIQLYLIADHVDGDLAVLSGKRTEFGAWFDPTLHLIFGSTTFLGFSICLGIYNQTHDPAILIIMFFVVSGIFILSVGSNINLESKAYVIKQKEETKYGRISFFFQDKTYEIISIAIILYYPVKLFLHLDALFLVMLLFATVYQLSWMGSMFFQYKYLKNK